MVECRLDATNTLRDAEIMAEHAVGMIRVDHSDEAGGRPHILHAVQGRFKALRGEVSGE